MKPETSTPQFAWLHKLAIALTGAALLGGCDSDMSDLRKFVADTKLKHQGRVDPLPDFAQYESFSYSDTGLRDPFKPHVDTVEELPASSTSGPRPSSNRRKEALESFPLDSLRMVGILQQKSTSWALVQDSEGIIHRVQPGNYAGQNHGKITGISENQITLVELVPDGISGWIQRDAKLALGGEE